jgi:hypothetical protein
LHVDGDEDAAVDVEVRLDDDERATGCELRECDHEERTEEAMHAGRMASLRRRAQVDATLSGGDARASSGGGGGP